MLIGAFFGLVGLSVALLATKITELAPMRNYRPVDSRNNAANPW
jgi:hypothetical protein